jgi:hypothetical protein
MPPWYPSIVVQSEPTSKLPYWKLQYPTYTKDIDPNAHIKVFKKIIKVNGKIVEADIINLFGFTLRNNILKRDKNFVQDHPNCIFEKLEQMFYKCFQNVKNEKEVYMQLKNLQQQVGEWVEFYYERLLKLANYLQVKATNVFLTSIFITCLQPYLRLAIVSMAKNTLIKHEEAAMICKENGRS